MVITVALGSFKGTITATKASDAVAQFLRSKFPEYKINAMPLADGGEGTLEIFQNLYELDEACFEVFGPNGTLVTAKVGLHRDGWAIIESSQAIGYSLIKDDNRDPYLASSFGIGQLIEHLMGMNVTKAYVTMGDSATMDMGMGMLNALGVDFYDSAGQCVIPSLSSFGKIVRIEDSALTKIRNKIEFIGLVDTNDYICGSSGQAKLYGKQKGLKEQELEIVESLYLSIAKIILNDKKLDITNIIRGSGSGGLAIALNCFLNAPLYNTLDYLSNIFSFDQILQESDINITGEGRLDKQTSYGKAPFFVAKNTRTKCYGLLGSITSEGKRDMDEVCTNFIPHTLNIDFSLSQPDIALAKATEEIFHSEKEKHISRRYSENE